MENRPRPESQEVAFPQRGEIYLGGSDPAVGHEIQKTRAALAIQNDISNQHSPITIVAAIHSRFSDPPFPRELLVEPAESGLPKRSAVIANQIRSVDRLRLQKRLGRLSPLGMERVDRAIEISLGLVDF